MLTSRKLTLRFTDWRCGHHCTRPDDIEVQTPEQALQICTAVAYAISQPGTARAVVFDAERYFTVYMTDDYVAAGHGDGIQVPDLNSWGWRPTVICGNAAEIEAIHSEPLAAALDLIHGTTDRLETLNFVDDYAIVTTTLTQEEVEHLAEPVDWYDRGDRKRLFDAPPVYLPAEGVLVELRAEKAAEDAYQEQLAAEAAGMAPHP